MTLHRLAYLLIEHGEGYRNRPYLDTATPPKWTWGIGRNLQDNPPSPADAKWLVIRSKVLEMAYGTRNLDKSPFTLEEWLKILNPTMIGKDLCLEFATKLTTDHIISIDSKLGKALSFYPDMVVPRRAVLIDMAYNMGDEFHRGWPNFVSAMKDEHYAKASKSMLDSLWAKQVHCHPPTDADPYGGRAYYLSQMMETAEIPTWVQDKEA